MDIAVIGGGGSIGREIAQLIISERILQYDKRLVLIANSKGISGKSIYGYAVDLQDAYAEITPNIEVKLNPSEIHADLIVMAAGATLPTAQDRKAVVRDRDALAEYNAPISEEERMMLVQNAADVQKKLNQFL